MKRRGTYLIILTALCLCLAGCHNKTENQVRDKEPAPVIIESVSPAVSASVTGEDSIQEVNYSDSFDGIEGCAVFLNSSTNVYSMYNKELCERRASPCSTFKIITTLMGLEQGVISSADSVMGYDKTVYAREAWNKEIRLKEAFQESCVWYFRKIIDQIGEKEVQNYLNQLQYGNCDITEWKGSQINSLPQLNGFWLESSLEISPREQVRVLADILGGKTEFSEETIEILKEVMLVQKTGTVSVYGKTGTGTSGNGWFTGMLEDSGQVYYFAVHLTDQEQEVSGIKAKEIALDIVEEYYVQR